MRRADSASFEWASALVLSSEIFGSSEAFFLASSNRSCSVFGASAGFSLTTGFLITGFGSAFTSVFTSALGSVFDPGEAVAGFLSPGAVSDSFGRALKSLPKKVPFLPELPSSASPEDGAVCRGEGVGRLSAAKPIEEIERAMRVQVSAGRIRRMGRVTEETLVWVGPSVEAQG